ncbi:MAG: hypothetical protein K9L85_02540 [Candidatus Peribacteraceae bacterium]|nr:hypothetical protein [Candidatus Peribacteraceae bacterium]
MFQISNRTRKNLCDTRGVSLLVVVGLVLVLVLIAAAVTKLVLGFIQTTSQVERANVAYSAAESGIELALYDLADYKDGYQTDTAQAVCGTSISLTQTANFNSECSSIRPYRFINFTNPALSGGRGFWRLFSRTLASGTEYFVPNSYFVGDKDGELESTEWGELNKNRPISLSLLTDQSPSQSEPADRFGFVSDTLEKKIIFDPGTSWNPGINGSSSDELFTWTFSAIDGLGVEHTLQGVAWESDFTDDCGDGRNDCLIFDLNDSSAHNPAAPNGDVYAGEDINRNLGNGRDSIGASFNRVSSISETFRYATPQEFLEDLGDAMDEISPEDQWTSARLTINLITTLSEVSGIPSNSLNYKLQSDEPWADEYTYIVSEGFAGDVKQTIETRFRRESVIPIFSYVIFQ